MPIDPTPRPTLPRATQLSLPLDLPDAIHFPQPLAEVVVRPRAVWRRLTPDLRTQVRHTLLRICQEVLDDPT